MSLRARILLLVLLAVAAPALALAWHLFERRAYEIEEAKRSLGALAQHAAENLDSRVNGTVQLLHGLSRAPDLDTADKTACSEFLGSVLARYPQYTGLLTFLPDGELHCDSLRTGRRLNVSARAYYKEVMATRQPAFDVVFGGLTGIAVLQVAYPVLDAGGRMKHGLLASLNLSQFARGFVAASNSPSLAMLIWSDDGMVMVREPEIPEGRLAGKKYPDAELFRFARASEVGATAELRGPVGYQAVWAIGVPAHPPGAGLRIALGVPSGVLLAQANADLYRALLILAAASLFAFLAAWSLAELGIRRPTKRIGDVAKRVGAGDLAARIGGPYPRGELGELMNVVDAMAGAVQGQQAAIRAASAALARSNRSLRMLSSINAAIVHIADRSELFRESVRIAVEEGGFRFAWMASLDAEVHGLRLEASAGVPELERLLPGALRERGAEPSGLGWEAALGRRPIVIPDVRSEPRLRLRRELEAAGARCAAVLPIVVRDRSVAVLGLVAADAGFFEAEEMKVLGEMTGDIGFALEHIRQSEALDHLANYDPVTGLANSALFHKRLAHALEAAGRGGRRLALYAVDIDRFKDINDTLGREAGDEVLRQVAARIAGPSSDLERFARMVADRFAVIGAAAQTEGEAVAIVEKRLLEGFSAPFAVAGKEIAIAVRCGIALFPEHGDDAASLFRNAEAALKRAKARGDRYLFYSPEMTQGLAEKLALERQMRQALEREEFVLHYQAKVDLETRELRGLEALIRWQSPELGMVPPARFIGLLEDTGLILPVGAWALKRAARDHRAWTEAGLRPPRVAVNVSAIQLRQKSFLDTVEEAILEGTAPVGLDLEVTESVLMQDVDATVARLEKVRALGVQVAMDDFGTGYSSLSYLSRLPVQTLKIDRSFVIRMLANEDTMTLVQAMISLAHALRLEVVAEGVDSEEQARALRLLRCDQMQGFLVSRPAPAEAIEAQLREGLPGGG